jgi:hypothetical protein
MTYRSTSSRGQLEAKIPGGPTTPEASRRLGVTNEVIETDAAGFPTVVRQRVRNRFLKLEGDGLLTKAEAKAAILLKALADRCTGRTLPSYQMKVDCSSGHPHDAMAANWDNRTKVEDALKCLSLELRKVAIAYILDERVEGMGSSFTAIGAYYHPAAKDDYKLIAGKTLVIAACRDLAVHFQLTSGMNKNA